MRQGEMKYMQGENQGKKVHRGKKILLKIVLLLIVLSIGIFFAFNSSVFNIKEIKVKNNKNIDEKNILKKSKIEKGTNIFKVKSEYVEKELLKNPFLKSVKVSKKVPSSINIEVVERKKTFLFQSTSIYLLADEDGFIMDHFDSKDKKLPTIKGFKTQTTELGKSIFSTGENENLKVFINEAKKLNLLAQIDEIDKNFANDVDIKLKNQISVAFGPLSNVKYKLSMLKEILEDIKEKKIKTGKIIMNEGDHPILIIDE